MPEPTPAQAAFNTEQRRLASLNARRSIVGDIEQLQSKVASRSRPRSIPDPAFSLERVLERLEDAQERLRLHDEEHERKFANVAPRQVDPLVAENQYVRERIANLEQERDRRIGEVAAAASR